MRKRAQLRGGWGWGGGPVPDVLGVRVREEESAVRGFLARGEDGGEGRTRSMTKRWPRRISAYTWGVWVWVTIDEGEGEGMLKCRTVVAVGTSE